MKRHTRKRFLLYGALALLVVVFAGGIYWCAKTAVANIEAQDKATAQTQEDARAIAEASRKKKAAELEKRQQEAAKQAAEAAKTGTASSADGASCNTSTSHNDPSRIDVLVNKKHCIQPLQFAPSDLITVQGATLSAKAAEAYVALFNAAAQAGQPFYVTSSYRSYATQITTYNYWVAQSGPAGADTYSARPGYSEHQTGLVIDVAAGGCTLDCFGSTSQYQWFQQYADEYGFIQRYYSGSEAVTGYKAEEWHYRYVGQATAQDMKKKGVKSLEEYWGMKGGDY